MRKRSFRTDIQALRTVAIVLVVANHLWPTRLPGGYVGVDVFFVISGFLITGHLVGELRRTGRVRLGAFYARRIRRLLPAAFVVLVAALLLTVVFLPYPRWERNAWEIGASATYVENWYLAAMSVNYSALNDAASMVQHYWSLSVEEQFYILWPLLLLAVASLAAGRVATGTRRSRKTRMTAALAILISVIGASSFLASVVYTQVAPSQAYFATFTRGWEFAIGGLIALAGQNLRLSSGIANVVSLLGFSSIAIAAVTFDHATAFPGYAAALPVLGTAAVIIAGSSPEPLWHAKFTAIPPIQWVGGISYSLYLWHWPLIVVAPFALRGEATTASKLGVLVLSVILAAVTKRFVEDPGQKWRVWSRTTWRAMALMIVGIIVIGSAVAGLLTAARTQDLANDPETEVTATACEGPTALAPGADCADPFGEVDYTVMTPKNEYFYTPQECGDFLPILSYGEKRTTLECDFSQGKSDAQHVWLIGDSHAQQWQGAVFDIAKDRKWIVTTSFYGGCPVADVQFTGFRGPWGDEDAELCRRWSHELSDAVAEARPDLVITAMASRLQTADDGSSLSSSEQMVEGLKRYWTRWSEAGSQVLAIADPPFNGEVRDPDCLTLSESEPTNCARPRADAHPTDPVVTAADSLASPSVGLVDLTDRFCDQSRCYAAVGGLPVYYDADHLNLEFVRLLRPELESAVDQLLGQQR